MGRGAGGTSGLGCRCELRRSISSWPSSIIVRSAPTRVSGRQAGRQGGGCGRGAGPGCARRQHGGVCGAKVVGSPPGAQCQAGPLQARHARAGAAPPARLLTKHVVEAQLLEGSHQLAGGGGACRRGCLEHSGRWQAAPRPPDAHAAVPAVGQARRSQEKQIRPCSSVPAGMPNSSPMATRTAGATCATTTLLRCLPAAKRQRAAVVECG